MSDYMFLLLFGISYGFAAAYICVAMKWAIELSEQMTATDLFIIVSGFVPLWNIAVFLFVVMYSDYEIVLWRKK